LTTIDGNLEAELTPCHVDSFTCNEATILLDVGSFLPGKLQGDAVKSHCESYLHIFFNDFVPVESCVSKTPSKNVLDDPWVLSE